MKSRDLVFGAAVAGCLVFAAGCATEAVTARGSVPPAEDTPGIVDNGVYNRLTAPAAAAYTAAPAAPVETAAPAPAAPKKYPRLVMSGTAAAKPAPVVPAGGESYTVVSGDSLSRIAQRHGVKLADLAAINGLDARTAVIYPGQKLVLPAGVKAVAGTPAAPKKADKPASTGTVVAAGGTYTVVAGDYPERIARRHGVSTRELLKANNLTERSILQIGQKLVIPGKGSASAAAPAPAPAPAPAAPAESTPSVTDIPVDPVEVPVVSGESNIDFGAAVETGAPAAPVVSEAANDPFQYTGKTLILVERAQTLQDLAAYHGVDAEVVRSLNPGMIGAGDMIEQNSVISIPTY